MVCFSTARSDSTSVAAMAALFLPCAISSRISRLAGGEAVEVGGRRRAWADDQRLDHLGVDHRPAPGHLPDGPAAARRRRPPAPSAGRPGPLEPSLEQREGVGRVGVLAEHDDADRRVRLAELGAARMPSSVPVGGMRMSVTTTSGCSCSTRASSSGEVADQTRRPRGRAGSESRARPSRNRALSSANTTRIPTRCTVDLAWPRGTWVVQESKR